MNYKIVTDSSGELPKDIIDKLDIDILPVIIILDDKQFLDGIDITPNTIFDGMKKDIVYKTSQISLNDYVEKFKQYAKDNIPLINITMSSGISSSFETSKMAVNMVKEEYKDAIIHTVDSKCCSLQMGIAVKYIAQAAKNGKSFEDIMKILEFCRENMTVLFTVSDLKYLQRGGRISKTSAVLGNALGIKPILTVSQDGKVEVKDKVRSKKKIISYIVDRFTSEIDENYAKEMDVYITNADAMDTVDDLKNILIEKFSMKQEQFIIQETGATIGVHTGPDSMYVFYMRKEVPKHLYS